MAEYAGHKFQRCPITYVGRREALVVSRARSEYLASLKPMERLRLPAKYHQALEHVGYLLELQKAEMRQ